MDSNPVLFDWQAPLAAHVANGLAMTLDPFATGVMASPSLLSTLVSTVLNGCLTSCFEEEDILGPDELIQKYFPYKGGMMDSLPDKVNVGGVVLKLMPEGRTPEHYQWKRCLEKDWAGAWTLAKLTNYKYKIGVDPAFAFEQPQYRKGKLQWFEWILCENGGILYLYDENEMIFHAKTTAQTAEKILEGVKEARLSLSTDQRLGREIRFPAAVLDQVCSLAGARIARKGRTLSEEEKSKLQKAGIASRFKASQPGLQPA